MAAFSSAMYERASCCFKIRATTDLLYCYLMFEGTTQSYATFANNVIIKFMYVFTLLIR